MAKKKEDRLYKPFEENLRAIWRQFKRCSEMYPPLYHDRLVAWSSGAPGDFTKDQWAAFIDANSEPNGGDGDWTLWDFPSNGSEGGRFRGSPDGLSEFQQLAKSVCIVIREMEIETDGTEYDAWLGILHDVAFRQYLPLLRSDMTFWNWDQPLGNDFRNLVDEWHVSNDGKREYPIHPCKWSLAHSVFISSMTMIEAILDPESVMLTSSALEHDYVSEVLQYVAPIEEDDDSSNDKGEEDDEVTILPTGNVFKRTETGTWHLRYVEDGVAEEHDFAHQEGFLICQQLLSSRQPVIPNRELGDQSKGQIKEGDSVVQEQDLLSSVSAGEEGLTDAKFWNETDSRQQMTTPEIIAWGKAENKHFKEQLQDARIAKDTAKIKEIEDEQKSHLKIMGQMINNRGESRDFAEGNRDERDRSRVAKALSKCLKTLERPVPLLHRFLKTNLKSNGGTGRRYLKANEVSWDT